jgi:protein translocase SecG subunit
MSIVRLVPYVQIVLSILLIILVLVQQSEAALGSAFGQDSFSAAHHTKRGVEKAIFIATIVVAILFAATSFSLLLI